MLFVHFFFVEVVPVVRTNNTVEMSPITESQMVLDEN